MLPEGCVLCLFAPPDKYVGEHKRAGELVHYGGYVYSLWMHVKEGEK